MLVLGVPLSHHPACLVGSRTFTNFHFPSVSSYPFSTLTSLEHSSSCEPSEGTHAARMETRDVGRTGTYPRLLNDQNLLPSYLSLCVFFIFDLCVGGVTESARLFCRDQKKSGDPPGAEASGD